MKPMPACLRRDEDGTLVFFTETTDTLHDVIRKSGEALHWISAPAIRPSLLSRLQSWWSGRRLEHEINIARQTGADYRDDALASAETQLASAKAILEGEVK